MALTGCQTLGFVVHRQSSAHVLNGPFITDILRSRLKEESCGSIYGPFSSPLNRLIGEASKRICKFLEQAISLYSVALSNIEYHHDRDWLRAFHENSLSESVSVMCRSPSRHIYDVIGASESVELTVFASVPLLGFGFHAPRSWNPKHSSLP